MSRQEHETNPKQINNYNRFNAAKQAEQLFKCVKMHLNVFGNCSKYQQMMNAITQDALERDDMENRTGKMSKCQICKFKNCIFHFQI